MKKGLSLSIAWCLTFTVYAQATFQKSIALDSASIGGVDFCECPDSSLIFCGLTGQIVKLSPAGDLIWGRQISTRLAGRLACGTDNSIFFTTVDSGVLSNAHKVVVKLTPDGDIAWDKIFDVSGNPWLENISATADGGCVFTSGALFFQQGFRYYRLSSEGDVIFSKSLETGASTDSYCITPLSSGDYAVGGWSNEPAALLARTGADGTPLWAKTYPGFGITGIDEFPNGDLFVVGRSSDFIATVFARLTAQGELLWAKSVGNEGFSLFGNASVTPDGGVLLRTGLESEPTGYIKMNADASVEWARGYPSGNLGLGMPAVPSGGGYLFMVPSYTLDSAGLAGLIKTDANGLLPNCEAFDICVHIRDFTTTSTSISWTAQSISYDTAYQSSVVPIAVRVEDYCAPPVYPSPLFQLPDSICAGSSVSPSELSQSTAGAWQWTFEGGNPNSSTLPSPRDIIFSSPGQFEVRQVIRFAGCADSFAIQLTVLPAAQPLLGPDTLLCNASTYWLDGSTPGAVGYLWDDGSTAPTRLVVENGVYSLAASNGLCETRAVVVVRFFDATYPNAVLDLGSDTTMCSNLPLALQAALPGAGLLVWDDGSHEPLRIVRQPGTYSATFFLENCPLFDEVEIVSSDCSGSVYLPNAFSPNRDRINDVWHPFGQGIIFKNLKIFDRWGGLLLDTDTPQNGWDGTVKGRDAYPGLYVVLLEYEHVLTGKRELLSGEVMLIR